MGLRKGTKLIKADIPCKNKECQSLKGPKKIGYCPACYEQLRRTGDRACSGCKKPILRNKARGKPNLRDKVALCGDCVERKRAEWSTTDAFCRACGTQAGTASGDGLCNCCYIGRGEHDAARQCTQCTKHWTYRNFSLAPQVTCVECFFDKVATVQDCYNRRQKVAGAVRVSGLGAKLVRKIYQFFTEPDAKINLNSLDVTGPYLTILREELAGQTPVGSAQAFRNQPRWSAVREYLQANQPSITTEPIQVEPDVKPTETPPIDFAKLREEALTGNEVAWEQLWKRTRPKIMPWLIRRYYLPGEEPADFETIVKIGFMEAVRDWKSELGVPFIAFVRLVTNREVLQAVTAANRPSRKNFRQARSLDGPAYSNSTRMYHETSYEEIVADPSSDPDLWLEAEEVAEVLPFLSKLQGRVAEVMIRNRGQATYQEIANELGVTYKSVDNVMQKIKRWAAKLKKRAA